MTEENVTKTFMKWLSRQGWKILSYDFPQSGTGVVLHPQRSNSRSKNARTIIPDIIAVKSRSIIVCENKCRYVQSDVEKVYKVKTSGLYSESIREFVGTSKLNKIFYGMGISDSKTSREKLHQHTRRIDFAFVVSKSGVVSVVVDHNELF